MDHTDIPSILLAAATLLRAAALLVKAVRSRPHRGSRRSPGRRSDGAG
jgi:hypothetical protein